MAVPWSALSFITTAIKVQATAWKNGAAQAHGGARGLAWKDELASQDVFECAANDCGLAVNNWRESRTGARHGKRAGFPAHKKKFTPTPSFWLRNRNKLTQVV